MKDWVLFSLITICLWAMWNIVPKFASQQMSPNTFVFFEGVGILIVGTGITLLGLWGGIEATPQNIGVAVLGGLAGGLGSTFYFLSVARGPVSLVSTITALYPILVIPIALVLFHETISLRQAVGIALGLVAVVLMTK